MKKNRSGMISIVLLWFILTSCAATTPVLRTSFSRNMAVTTKTEIVLNAATSLCVTAEVLTLRAGPDVSFQPITWLTKGAQITKLSSVGNWLEVTSRRYRGFVNSRFTGECP